MNTRVKERNDRDKIDQSTKNYIIAYLTSKGISFDLAVYEAERLTNLPFERKQK